jgi:hypothetical protein
MKIFLLLLLCNNVFAFNVFNNSKNISLAVYCQPSNKYLKIMANQHARCNNGDVGLKFGEFPQSIKQLYDSKLIFNLTSIHSNQALDSFSLMPGRVTKLREQFYAYDSVVGLKDGENIYFNNFSNLFPTGYFTVKL